MQEAILQIPKVKLGKIKLKPFSGFRQYRADLLDGRFVIVKDRIPNKAVLLKWIKIFHPINLYESTACTLNPVRVRGYKKSSYRYADRIFLNHLVLIDIDQLNLNEVARVKQYFEEHHKDYTLWKIVCSGGGYHLYYTDEDKATFADPEKRFQYLKERRTALKEELKAAGINFDGPVLDDLHRVSRVIGTWNGNKNKLSYEIPQAQIPVSTKEVLNPSLGERTEAEPKSQKDEARPVYLDRFISNKVPGVKDRYAMVFLWNENVNYKKFLREDQKLGKVSIFKFGKMIQGISSKTVSAARLTKILYKTRSLNLNSWLKYGHCWFYLGRKELPSFEAGKEILKLASDWKISQIASSLKMDVPQFVEVVNCSPTTYFASLPHEKAIEFLSGTPSSHQLLHGDSKIKEHLVMR